MFKSRVASIPAGGPAAVADDITRLVHQKEGKNEW